jgi:Transglycosylase SLT domain
LHTPDHVRVGLAAGLLFFASCALAQTPEPDFPDIPLPPAIESLMGMPRAYTPGRKAHLDAIRREAEQVGLPPDIGDAVAQVESAYDPGAVGGVGEIGLMQICPTTAAMLGYRGTLAGLFEPETNIRYGVAYLARAWQLAEGDLCRALMKYRAGHGEERMTPLSVEYCRRVRTHLAAIGSPFAAGTYAVSVSPTFDASRTASSTASDMAATSDVAGSMNRAKSARAEPTQVLPPQRPLKASIAATAVRLKVPSAERRYVALVQGKETRRKAMIRQMWAAHEARVQSISARLRPECLRISTGI